MLLKTERPQRTDLTMDLKLSSMITISAACFATSVPGQPHTRACHSVVVVWVLTKYLVEWPSQGETSKWLINSRNALHLAHGEYTNRNFPASCAI